jgi:nucleotide-binding universal stress UspA family protein
VNGVPALIERGIAMTTTSRTADLRTPGAKTLVRPVIVGVDDSPASSAALEWAAAEAASRHAPLKIVHCWTWQVLAPWSMSVDRMVVGELKRDGRQLVEKCRRIAETQQGLAVSTEVAEGYPPAVLSVLGAEAALVVLGARRHTAVGRAVLGSVSNAMASRAPCPVVVAGARSGPLDEQPSVVAGIAGGEQDESVLAFAFEQAQRRRRPLRLMYCWHPLLSDARLPAPESAHLRLAESIAGWRDEYPDVDVLPSVVHAHPVDALVGASTAQDLLVVGRRAQHLRFGGVLGSVTLGVLHHATCPVAVVPPPVSS